MIPDKRYCFDFLREKSSLARVVDAMGRNNHSEGAIVEYFLTVANKSGNLAWDAAAEGAIDFFHDQQQAESAVQRTRNGDFLDIHEWVFTPSSLRLIVEDLFCLKLISLREDSFADTVGFEFFVTMSRSGRGPDIDRLSLLLRNASEH